LIIFEHGLRRGLVELFQGIEIRFVGVSTDNVTPWVRSWLAKFETAKVGDGSIALTRFDKSLNTA